MRVCGIVLFLAFLIVLSGDSRGIGNNPVGPGFAPSNNAIYGGVGSVRVPGGIYRDGLVLSPNPMIGSGNLIVTGNVRGGKYFQGVVPYQSPYSLDTAIPSSSLDTFLRDSVGSEDIGGGASKYMTQPYYSGTGTVTTVGSVGGGVPQPANTRVNDHVSSNPMDVGQGTWDVYRSSSVVSPSIPAMTPYTNAELRPLSMNPIELERVIFDEMETFSGSKKLTDEQPQLLAAPLLQDTGVASDKAAELKQSLLVKNELLQLPVVTEPNAGKWEKIKGRNLLQLEGENVPQLQEEAFKVGFPQSGVNPNAQVDVYEQMKQQINNVKRLLEQFAGIESAKEVNDTDRAKRLDEKRLLVEIGEQRGGQSIAMNKEEKQELTVSKELRPRLLSQNEAAEKSNVLEEPSEATSGLVPTKEGTSGRAEITPQVSEKESGTELVGTELKGDVAAKAREILGEHKTFASFAEDKFNRYMRAAEEYLKLGRYYRAADAYTLAAIYKPNDPLAYAGKSHALFAAGEYMSSALFLSRALEIFPEYAQFKIGLVAMVGDKDKLESRIANVEKWLNESDAAELKFLLAYVYYQMGRHPEAKKMIDAAFEEMPQSTAVAALKKAIDTDLIF
jgi:tetratricopeptide (TPR) repeat protein